MTDKNGDVVKWGNNPKAVQEHLWHGCIKDDFRNLFADI